MAKIIVADDEMLIRRLVCDFLIKEGHAPLEAADGKMAVELFNQNPDTALIIMDIMMPELDGWEATRGNKTALCRAYYAAFGKKSGL